MKRFIPEEPLRQIETDLVRFGDRVVGDIQEWGREAESTPPKLVQYNGWGKRIDEIVVSNGWKQLGRCAAEEGLISIAYERRLGEYSRIHQMIKNYVFAQTSAMYSCPLAMTDGAARLIETLPQKSEPLVSQVFERLIDRSPETYWTSGQWMTEKTGGSDVRICETIAVKSDDAEDGQNVYKLSGFKYFTSSTTSQVAFALGKIMPEDGNWKEANLSVFMIHTRKPDGSLNNITIHKLKEKLGTKAVPTSELELNGTKAYLVGKPGRGVATIASLFNVTRIWTTCGNVSSMRRALTTARDYTFKRFAFGRFLSENPLHLRTLASLEVTFRGNMQIFFDIVRLQGKSDAEVSTPGEESLLRLVLPLSKLYTAKEGSPFIAECMEILGGTGYMEDASDLPAHFRNQKVNSIWEGTTNVIAHDVLRVLGKDPVAAVSSFGAALVSNAQLSEQASRDESLSFASKAVLANWERIKAYVAEMPSLVAQDKAEEIYANAREFSYSLASTYIGSLLLKHASNSQDASDIHTAQRWAHTKLTLPTSSLQAHTADPKPKESILHIDRLLALGSEAARL
eukprot:TRINITY_DN2724_c0_g1_i1.p1 TRINITY_DN2724_c0_g1~~TRINITY_DN2724_c0_g1_i1.p1  ORF type:complete len:639 (+),score=251.02 TRINITY_DN2724_c0_g1_i1:213-1919(+)